MKIESLFVIEGIGSASGLIYENNQLFIVCDNANYLYQYSMHDNHLSRIPLANAEVMEAIPKELKLDLESLVRFEDMLYIFGSGSTVNRNFMFEVDLENQNVIEHNLDYFYDRLKDFAEISNCDFNIEGTILNEGIWYFFQRGNAGTGKNGVFKIKGNLMDDNYLIEFTEIRLPKIEDVTTSFTDAVWVNDRIYFLATAERTLSAYDDGHILGTLVGQIDPATMEVFNTQLISNLHKFEGLTLFKQTADNIEFLLCEDNDSDEPNSVIYKLSISVD